MNTTIRFDTESFVNSLHADDLLLLSFAVEKSLNDLALLFRRENPPLAEERAIQYIKRMRQQGVDKSLVFLKRVYDSPAIEKAA